MMVKCWNCGSMGTEPSMKPVAAGGHVCPICLDEFHRGAAVSDDTDRYIVIGFDPYETSIYPRSDKTMSYEEARKVYDEIKPHTRETILARVVESTDEAKERVKGSVDQ